MDVGNIEQKNNMFVEIDKKITIKYLKEIKTNRTYVCGLSDFMSDEKINLFTKFLKKQLGAGMNIKKISNTNNMIKLEYGFQGNHLERIRNIILEETDISDDKIKVIN